MNAVVPFIMHGKEYRGNKPKLGLRRVFLNEYST
jgi:hypothetical protein